MSGDETPVLHAPGSNLPRRPCIDVAHLPASVLDHRSPIWIGNLILVLIESVVFGILIASYFYLRRNFDLWPPPMINRQPVILNPLPGLGATTLNFVLLIASLVPFIYTDRAALHRRTLATKVGLVVCLVTVCIIIAVRFFEFQSLHFKWSDNAYAALTWTTLGVHLMHLFIALGEALLMTAWIFIKGMDAKHARDIRVTAVYWYWIVGTWVPLYFILIIGPRL